MKLVWNLCSMKLHFHRKQKGPVRAIKRKSPDQRPKAKSQVHLKSVKLILRLYFNTKDKTRTDHMNTNELERILLFRRLKLWYFVRSRKHHPEWSANRVALSSGLMGVRVWWPMRAIVEWHQVLTSPSKSWKRQTRLSIPICTRLMFLTTIRCRSIQARCPRHDTVCATTWINKSFKRRPNKYYCSSHQCSIIRAIITGIKLLF